MGGLCKFDWKDRQSDTLAEDHIHGSTAVSDSNHMWTCLPTAKEPQIRLQGPHDEWVLRLPGLATSLRVHPKARCKHPSVHRYVFRSVPQGRGTSRVQIQQKYVAGPWEYDRNHSEAAATDNASSIQDMAAAKSEQEMQAVLEEKMQSMQAEMKRARWYITLMTSVQCICQLVHAVCIQVKLLVNILLAGRILNRGLREVANKDV